MFKGIVKRIVATSVAAASVFLAVVFLGVAIFHAISLVTTPLGASAITFSSASSALDRLPSSIGSSRTDNSFSISLLISASQS